MPRSILKLVGLSCLLVTGAIATGLLPLSDGAAQMLQRLREPRTPQADPAGTTRHVIAVAGGRREYLLLDASRPGSRAPLVVVLHGGGGNAASMVARWADKARAEGLVVAFPDGISQRAHMGTWNAGGCCAYAMTSGSDDVGFIRAVIDEVEAAGRVDPRRVYLTGMSNGGMMSYRAALALSDRVAAVGIVAGAMFGGETPPAHPLPILIIHGVRDQIVPYEGGTSPMALVAQSQRAPFQAARTTVDFWRRADGCEGEPRRTTSGDVTVETSAPCRDGSEVVFYNLASANHTWPGAAAEAPFLERFRYDQINATDILWDFFRRHARS